MSFFAHLIPCQLVIFCQQLLYVSPPKKLAFIAWMQVSSYRILMHSGFQSGVSEHFSPLLFFLAPLRWSHVVDGDRPTWLGCISLKHQSSNRATVDSWSARWWQHKWGPLGWDEGTAWLLMGNLRQTWTFGQVFALNCGTESLLSTQQFWLNRIATLGIPGEGDVIQSSKSTNRYVTPLRGGCPSTQVILLLTRCPPLPISHQNECVTQLTHDPAHPCWARHMNSSAEEERFFFTLLRNAQVIKMFSPIHVWMICFSGMAAAMDRSNS